MVFDLDGTLITSGPDIASAVNYTLETLGLPARAYHDIINWIGDGIHLLIERALGDENKELRPEALNLFSDYYERHMLDTTEPYQGIREVLNHFSQKRKIVLTNKRVFFAEEILEALALSRCFMEIIGADSNSSRKPDPGVLQPVIEKYALKKEMVVMIGDGINDLLLAKNTGVIGCAFLNGLTERSRLMDLSPDVIYENPEELIHLFK